ncbi:MULTISPECIES: succinate dehydrogenase, cytochrome b556 subunit [unclassified Shimia]|uniref:succinate dehydrogenase, cytochrome b556 subunit n=1 Tax=unclassified Shimia TaxID=2630038 RepID=UPI001ADCCC10|nr:MULTISPECIES: succinate dehydrogenase, cytochrome b556 subunit [unclassified Shimia]MBO9475629.1 succinate dehydrogenase, cytochrome b556 subunit [Shimia sp. R10_1]MDA5558364.1 succinate dehydrogenase, cytochrome b556 subunit [Shimia sp. MMG029]
MADVKRIERPLSPHLQIYRPQMTSVSSIFVRITGIALIPIAAVVVWWLLAAATSESAFAFIDGLLRSFLGDVFLFLSAWAVFYHMLGRLRHVIWDFGYCLDIETAVKLGKGMFVGATVLSIATALIV